jgi:hypothetical protein
MFTWGSKYFFGLSAAALVAALVYAIVSGGSVIGGLSLGWKGGVGDHLGYAVLLGLALGLFVMGVVAVWVRDAEAEAVALVVGTERVPQAVPPSHPSYWGALTAFGVGALIVGATVSRWFLYLGFGLLFVVALEWAVLAWTDRATGDARANRTLRNRLMSPIEVPLFGAVAIAVFAVGVSRVLLAVSSEAAVGIAALVAALAFGMAVAFAYRPGWFSRNIVTGLVAAFAGLVLVGGVVGAAVGPREFEHHGEGHGEGGSVEEGTSGEGQGGTAPGPGEEDPSAGTRRPSGQGGGS